MKYRITIEIDNQPTETIKENIDELLGYAGGQVIGIERLEQKNGLAKQV